MKAPWVNTALALAAQALALLLLRPEAPRVALLWSAAFSLGAASDLLALWWVRRRRRRPVQGPEAVFWPALWGLAALGGAFLQGVAAQHAPGVPGLVLVIAAGTALFRVPAWGVMVLP